MFYIITSNYYYYYFLLNFEYVDCWSGCIMSLSLAVIIDIIIILWYVHYMGVNSISTISQKKGPLLREGHLLGAFL